MTNQLDTERASRRGPFVTKFSSVTSVCGVVRRFWAVLIGRCLTIRPEWDLLALHRLPERVRQLAAVHRLARSSSSAFRPRFSGEVWRKSPDLPAAECLFSGLNDRGRPWLLSGNRGNRTRRGPLNLKLVFLRGSGKQRSSPVNEVKLALLLQVGLFSLKQLK